MLEKETHHWPMRNWKQLAVVVALAFIIPIALTILVTQWVTGGTTGMQENDSAILARIRPVGTVQLKAAAGAKALLTGEQVYGQVCKACHEAGLLNAPKLGDKAGWTKVLAQGQAMTVSHALKGIRSMPAKGGNADLENVEVERAVVFMANKAGGNWKEPAVMAPVTVTASSERSGEEVVAATCSKCHATGEGGAPKIGDRAAWRDRVKGGYKRVLQSALKGHAGMPARGGMAELSDVEIGRAVEYMMNSGADKSAAAAAAVAVPVAAAAPAAAAKPDGKKIYDTTCMVCHGAGIAGAPKFGDKAAWAPRIKTGIDALYKVALTGKGAMPPKGGNKDLTDADVKAAVDYMVAAAK